MCKLSPALVLASLAIVSCRSADTGRVDSTLAAYIPNDTVMLAGFRLAEIRSTPVYQKLQANDYLLPLESLRHATGIDPRKDVTEFVVAANGKDALTIARGQFKPADITAKKSVYKARTIYARGRACYALMNASTVLAGSETEVRAAIDQAQSGKRNPAVAALMARSGSIAPQNQIWAITSSASDMFNRAFRESGNAANLNNVFGQLDQVTLAADLHAGMNVVITGDCRTEQDAKTLGDALRGLVSLGKLSVPPSHKEWLRFYDAIQVDALQKSVKLSANVPQDLIDKVLTVVPPARTR